MTLDFARADKLWESNTSHEKRQNGAVRAVPSAATATLATHKASHEEYRAKLAELEYRERAGQLGDMAEVEREREDSGRRLSQLILQVPDRHAAMMDPETYLSIKKELRDVLYKFAIECGAIGNVE